MEMGSTRIAGMTEHITREADKLFAEAQCWSTKYIGDATIALWVHPKVELQRADVVKVFDIVGAYQTILQATEGLFDPPAPLRFGCGYSAGKAAIGDIGSAGASDLTAMGEAVNGAFRLESATREVGCDVLIARSVFVALSRPIPDKMMEIGAAGGKEPLQALPLQVAEMPVFLRSLFS
jgi:adenylate cyclase